jgi:hypothetical protein
MRVYTYSIGRVALGGAIFVAALAVFLLRPGIALAHHVELSATTDCYTYTIEADYIGGDEARYAEVRVNGTLVGTYNFPAGTEESDNFYVLTGDLPVDVTVEVRMYKPQPGPDSLEDVDVVTVDESPTCTATATATGTATPSSTNTPIPTATDTATMVPTDTPAPTDTPQPTDTPVDTPTPAPTETTVIEGTVTPAPSATNTSVPTNTPQLSTHTPVATSTSTPETEIEETPTYVSTVESLLPPTGPEGPSTSDSPPSGTASGLPNAGEGARGAQGIVFGLLATLLAGAGLGVVASGVRRAI